MENTMIKAGKSTVNALESMVTNYGYDLVKHSEDGKDKAYVLTHKAVVDGLESEQEVRVTDNTEKSIIDFADFMANFEKIAPPITCRGLAYSYEQKTWSEQGFKKFSDYAKLWNSGISDNTIRQYTNIGLCFMKKGYDRTESPFVDDRFKGVKVGVLQEIISHFKSWVDKKEIGDSVDYRDYVSEYYDTFCADSVDDKGNVVKAKIHLKDAAGAKKVREEVSKLKPSKKSDNSDKKSDNNSKKSNNSDNLKPYDALKLATIAYLAEKSQNSEIANLCTQLKELFKKKKKKSEQ